MKTYVTFGRGHVHRVEGRLIDHNCVVLLNGDRAKVFETFGAKFCFEYSEEEWNQRDIKLFPRGIIEIGFPVVSRKHILYAGFDDEAPVQIKDRNGEVCLALCKVCGGMECSLPTNCPGRELTFEEMELICNGELDF